MFQLLKWRQVEEAVFAGNVGFEAEVLDVRSQLASLCKVDKFVDPRNIILEGRGTRLRETR